MSALSRDRVKTHFHLLFAHFIGSYLAWMRIGGGFPGCEEVFSSICQAPQREFVVSQICFLRLFWLKLGNRIQLTTEFYSLSKLFFRTFVGVKTEQEKSAG